MSYAHFAVLRATARSLRVWNRLLTRALKVLGIIDSKLCDQEGSFPWCSSRKHRRAKNSSRGLQHIQEMQKEEKRWYIGSLSEQSKVQSITSGTWVDRRVVRKTRRTCAGGPFIHVHSQRTPTPRINLDRSSQQFGQNGPMAERPGYAEAARIRNRLYKKSGEANGRIHPSQQRRQRSHNPCLETSQGSARLDRKTGWEWCSNPSPWTTSEFWRALSS